MGPNLDHSTSFLIFTQPSRGTVFHMTSVLLNSLALLQSFPPKIQLLLLRTAHRPSSNIVMKIACAIPISLLLASLPGPNQHLQLLCCRFCQLTATAITPIGHTQHRCRCSGILLRLLEHPHQLASIRFFHRYFSGHHYPVALIHYRLSVVGKGLPAGAVHPPGFGFLGVIMAAPILLQLLQSGPDHLPQRLALLQLLRQAVSGGLLTRSLLLQLLVPFVQFCLQLSQQLLHLFFGPATVRRGQGLYLGAIDSLQG